MALQGDLSGTGFEPLDVRSMAARSLRRKRDFTGHLVAYVGVNALLLTIWFVMGVTTGGWFPWPLFPMVGWGIGLAFHAFATYGPASRPFSDAAIEQEVRRLERV